MADNMSAEANVVLLADEQAVAGAACERTVAGLNAAIADHGEAHLVLTGGSSAVSLYRELSQPMWRDAVDWSRVHLWWGDDRFVPSDHPESNAGLAYRLLMAWSARLGESGIGGQSDDVKSGVMSALEIPAHNVHPIPMELTIGASQTPEMAAQRYADEIRRFVPAGDQGVPAFDVFHLGVGPDGHLMSVFPNSPALADDAPLVLGIAAPDHVEPHLRRVTMSPRVLPAAGQVIVMVSGDSKADIVASLLGTERDVARWPAQSAVLPNAVWLLDAAAAAQLKAG
ncbi:MAG: 6-phosphogluconolactonase [Candidatus Limnocylindrales bacterium]